MRDVNANPLDYVEMPNLRRRQQDLSEISTRQIQT